MCQVVVATKDMRATERLAVYAQKEVFMMGRSAMHASSVLQMLPRARNVPLVASRTRQYARVMLGIMVMVFCVLHDGYGDGLSCRYFADLFVCLAK